MAGEEGTVLAGGDGTPGGEQATAGNEQQQGDVTSRQDEQTVLAGEQNSEQQQQENSEQQEENSEQQEELTFAPEGGYAEYTLPDGVTPNPQAAENFNALAATLNGGRGLNQADAQSLVDFFVASMKETSDGQVQEFVNLRNGWLAEAKKDEAIGGQNFSNTVEQSKRAVAKYGDAALGEVMETFGLGNHPAVLRFLSKVGKDLGEDVIVNSDVGSGGDKKGQKSQADAIFTSMNK